MEVNCWDKCFLCRTNFGSTSSLPSSCRGKGAKGRPKQMKVSGNPKLTVLIKYLLGSWDQNQNDSLLQRIRRLQLPNSTSSSEGLIQFCDKCQDSARRISHLQMELEVIQMKIVDILCALRKAVIDNSRGHHYGTSRLSLEEFTEERQEVFDTLYAFQAAVIEKSKESVHVPLVYIEKFTGCNLKTNLSNQSLTAEEDENLNLIKTEPEADSFEEILSDFGDDYDHAPTPIEFNDGVVVEDDDWQQEEWMDTDNGINLMPTESAQAPLASSSSPLPEMDLLLPPLPPRELQKRSIMSKMLKGKEEKFPGKRGRPRKIPPAQEIKEEQAEFLSLSSEYDGSLNAIIKEENAGDQTAGTRKARSAAQTAVKRIASVKKLSRASYQYRPTKVPKRAKKHKELKTRKSKEVKTKRKSTRASSSSRPPPNPAKILHNPVLKTGKIFRPPNHGGKKSKRTKAASTPPRRLNSSFVCEICPYKTHVNFKFEHHLSQHESPEVVNHICPHCTNPPRQFSQKQSFDYHMNSHSGLNKMRCELCPKFIDPFGLLEHLLRSHSNVEKVFQCSCCSYLCGTREAYLKHTQYHSTSALVCDVCSKRFRKRQRMFEHMHEEHKLLKKIKCDVANCDKEFFEYATMRAHKKRHTEAFVCSECNVQFPGMRHLLGHQVREHSREKPFACSECPETFIEKQSLQRHLINAHGASTLKCPYCPKEFANRVVLAAHMNLHEGISFPCDQCEKVFGDRGRLTSHQVVHNTTKDFICEECGKAFRYASLLRTHIKIHIGDKKHKCSFCSKGFVDRQNLICHERIHTGEKPFVCEACGKDFNQRSALNVHMRRQHKEIIAIKNKRCKLGRHPRLGH